jgi:hypothetical protein
LGLQTEAASMQILNKLKQLDAYPKVNEDFYSRTLSGGLITVISSVFMALLFITELRLFFYPQTTNQLVVDTARGETLTINVSCVVPPPPPHRPQICFNNSQTFSVENSQHLICAPRNHFEELPNIRLCALPIVQKNHFNLQPKTKKVQHSSANFRVFLNLGF